MSATRLFPLAAVLLASACNPPHAAVQGNKAQPVAATDSKGMPVTGQFIPPNQRFSTLDQYLDWLRATEEPVDGAWYKEVEPDRFELQTGGNLHLDQPSGEQRIFTRDELERKFGFKK